ncbi:hypothetical protein BX591_102610 [Paraburkholderia bryophila]|uniref:DNA adenine methylase n=1 Tax=Paraburkholderia bryophila TaxID=420952 RepID=A0A329D224_9BURK|nr:hypothetical protein BX591_102610 [Paraburkholderia bryophila]
MASLMRSMKGKAMVSINDHADIRRALEGFPMLRVDIKYAVSNTNGGHSTSRELVITNWEPGTQTDGLFWARGRMFRGADQAPQTMTSGA